VLGRVIFVKGHTRRGRRDNPHHGSRLDWQTIDAARLRYVHCTRRQRLVWHGQRDRGVSTAATRPGYVAPTTFAVLGGIGPGHALEFTESTWRMLRADEAAVYVVTGDAVSVRDFVQTGFPKGQSELGVALLE
jgi:hypothetical protein